GHNLAKWCGIQYERLEDFCFYCGRLDHVDRDCQAPLPDGGMKAVVYEYGPWLGSSPKRRLRSSYAEREKTKQCLARMQRPMGQRLPGYNDPLAVRRRPPGPARKLHFSSPSQPTCSGSSERSIMGLKTGRSLEVESLSPPPGFEHMHGNCGTVNLVKAPVSVDNGDKEVPPKPVGISVGEVRKIGSNDSKVPSARQAQEKNANREGSDGKCRVSLSSPPCPVSSKGTGKLWKRKAR
ncbi:hypothetical protein SOVF_214260, partial [Spinacia oleracea]